MPDRDPLELGLDLVKAADEAGMRARLLGGVAVALRCPTSSLAGFAREYEDVDIAVARAGRRHIDAVAARCGLHPDTEFNRYHGQDRRIYYGNESGKLDVFIGEFSMCHSLSLEDRLEVDYPTVPLAELFLTKAQIYELNRKDVFDLFALLCDHQIGDSDGDTINGDEVARLCSKDWGLWRTVSRTLDTLERVAATEMEARQRDAVRGAIARLRVKLEKTQKSSKWKLRNKVGDRVVWYTLPEDPERRGRAGGVSA